MSVLKVRDANGKWVSIPSIKGEDGSVETHADRHRIGGEDQLRPKDIGAAEFNHTHSPFDCGAAPENHTHTPADIGASPIGHNHDERYYTETEVDNLLATRAPKHTWGTEDIEAGSPSAEPEGTLHLVVE